MSRTTTEFLFLSSKTLKDLLLFRQTNLNNIGRKLVSWGTPPPVDNYGMSSP